MAMLAPSVLGPTSSSSRLADAWLADGATAFAIYQGTSCLLQRGTPDPDRVVELSARVRTRGFDELEVRVGGVSGVAAQRRLEAEAQLLADVLRLDDELWQMTGEFIDTQDQLLAVFELARATRRHIRLDEVLSDLVAEVRRLTTAEFAFTCVSGLGLDRLVCEPAISEEWRDVVRRADHQTRLSGPLLIVDSMIGEGPDIGMPDFVSNLATVPIEIEGQPVATLGLANQRDTRLSAGTHKLLNAVAELAGALIESASLHDRALARERSQRELELAMAIQKALLPHSVPPVAGLDVVTRFRPAAEIGGDFFDYTLLRDGRFAICVGDVCGKGWPAALLMTMTLAVLRGAAQLVDGPSAVLERANAELYADLSGLDSFVTAFAAQYDAAAGQLTFASAGHSPVLYLARGRQARLLHATGVPLGVLRDDVPGTDAVRLGPGDVVVVATDGLSEACSPDGELFGHERLMALIESMAAAPATAIADELFAAVAEFAAGQAQADDQTLLVVKGT
jgi:sigma-B regulation protein RsbU (phosphoserine phosphatase)